MKRAISAYDSCDDATLNSVCVAFSTSCTYLISKFYDYKSFANLLAKLEQAIPTFPI